ncbi:ABC transporter ATP-binding protein [Azospira sp. I13]|uniref:ABC transporter ATP-binding protein n=1 Tax=Azospira sp. I13 TaxID=1765050 RepID=UPI000D4E2FBD|nr:ABC transporter ATP-binding protein [Azospira sp. I13]GBG02668.1 ABC transporter ATP-binding protein [Azospira sp. I13]
MSDLLSVRGLKAGFLAGGRVLTAVDGVSFTVAPGETFALLGESGCGKSATALALLRLLPDAGRILAGEVWLEGEEVLGLPESAMRDRRGSAAAMIFQEPATSLNPVLTVGRQIGESLARHRGLQGEAARQEALALLAAVGIADPARRLEEYPFQLSGGMKQRVMIAIALAGEPRLLIADEPTTALDVTIQAQILDLLAKLQTERAMGMLLITHDLGVVARSAHRVGVMYAGEIVEMADRQSFFGCPRHPYTQKLFAALPDLGQRGGQLATIPGQVPGLAAMPAGCRFAPRCPVAMDRCREQSPDWTELARGHRVRCHWVAGQVESVAAEAALSVADATPAVSPTVPALSGGGQTRAAPLLQVSDLKVHFPIRKGLLKRTVGHVKAVDGVSLELQRGRTLALVGESGCGKTTAGKALLRLLPATGSVQLEGKELLPLSIGELKPLRRRMQMVFQDPFASLNPRLTVGEILEEGVRALQVGTPGQERRQALEALLASVGLPPEALGRYPHEFSGGQRQRIAIARALAVQPELLICDEPTSALDVSVQAQILNLLRQLQDSLGLAYLFITHNFAVVEYLAHEVAVMYLGRIVEQGPVAQVLERPCHPYTRALLSAVPEPRLEGQREMIRLPGETPSPARPPAGCHFHPRCAQAMDVCRQAYPPLSHPESGVQVRCHLYPPE